MPGALAGPAATALGAGASTRPSGDASAPAQGGQGIAQVASAAGSSAAGAAAAVAALLFTAALAMPRRWRRLLLPPAGPSPVGFVSLLERPG